MEKLIYTWQEQISDTNKICDKNDVKSSALDLGCGTGYVGLTVAKNTKHKNNYYFSHKNIIYHFKNLRPDTYQIIAMKDVGGNYLFDQNVDKIGFVEDPITLPGDSLINFRIFKEVPNLFWSRPFIINKNKINQYLKKGWSRNKIIENLIKNEMS